MSKKLYKTIAMTDIHFGAKNNSDQHNQDCIDYIDWFCKKAVENQVDNVIFLGDWFENRAAVNISTLNYSYRGAKKINDLGLPVYFVIGNHDLYHRHTRELYSTIQFHEFSNFTIINEPIIITDIVNNPLICPYLFHDEYENLFQYNKVSTWWGHFEFKGFIVTGYNIAMPTGPDHTLFNGPKYIFSGHFHKRQKGGNVVYIGNTFPTNFGDIDDTQRGLMIYDHSKQKISFIDWLECPKYIKTTLTALLDGNVIIPPNSRVKCVMDIPISFEESSSLKNELTETFKLREFVSEESIEITEAISGTIITTDNDTIIISGIDELIIQMLKSIDVANIDNDLLIEQYRKLK